MRCNVTNERNFQHYILYWIVHTVLFCTVQYCTRIIVCIVYEWTLEFYPLARSSMYSYNTFIHIPRPLYTYTVQYKSYLCDNVRDKHTLNVRDTVQFVYILRIVHFHIVIVLYLYMHSYVQYNSFFPDYLNLLRTTYRIQILPFAHQSN